MDVAACAASREAREQAVRNLNDKASIKISELRDLVRLVRKGRGASDKALDAAQRTIDRLCLERFQREVGKWSWE